MLIVNDEESFFPMVRSKLNSNIINACSDKNNNTRLNDSYLAFNITAKLMSASPHRSVDACVATEERLSESWSYNPICDVWEAALLLFSVMSVYIFTVSNCFSHARTYQSQVRPHLFTIPCGYIHWMKLGSHLRSSIHLGSLNFCSFVFFFFVVELC